MQSAPETNRELFDSPLPHFPVLHANETLYSWCAVVHLLNGRATAVRTSRQLFASAYAALAHDIPSHLEVLAHRTDDLLPIAQQLIHRHSLPGFFLPWLTEVAAGRVMSHALLGTCKDIKYHLGLPASGLGGRHPLKACPACIEADLGRQGYAHWHVDHQYPTTWVCTQHGMGLLRFPTPRSLRHYREWFLPHRIDPGDWIALPKLSLAAHSALSHLAGLSAPLASLPACHFHRARLARTYQLALQARGHLTADGCLRLRFLIQAILSKYRGLRGVPGFHLLDSLSTECASFIGNVARRQPKPAHPMKHLLLIGLLFDNWADFVTAYERTRDSLAQRPTIGPQQIGGEDHRQAVFVGLVRAEGLSISAAGRQVGVSASTAVRWAKLRGLAYTPRTKCLTPAVLEQCRQRLRGGAAKSEISRQTGVSMTSITRLLSSEPDLRAAWRDAIFRARQRHYRADFLTLLAENPGVPIKLLRKYPNNRYAWLYRHDRQWLIEHLPTLERRVNPRLPP